MRLTNEQREQVITLRYLMSSERDDAPEAERILENLLG